MADQHYTDICPDFDNCPRGTDCNFSHPESKTAEQTADPCRDFMKGRCDRGSSCRYSHDVDVNSHKESEVCRNFLKGKCDRGLNCRYIHPTKEGEHGTAEEGAPNENNESSSEVCRDYLKGRCSRGVSCKFFHPNDGRGEGKKSYIVVCQDFQTRNCDREYCNYMHISKKVESLYNEVGVGVRPNGICHVQLRGTCPRGTDCRYYHVPTSEMAADDICRDNLKKQCSRGGSCKFRHVNDKEYAMEKEFLHIAGVTIAEALRFGLRRSSSGRRGRDLLDLPDLEMIHRRPLKRRHEDDDMLMEENEILRRKLHDAQGQVLDLRADNTALQRMVLTLRESNEDLREQLITYRQRFMTSASDRS